MLNSGRDNKSPPNLYTEIEKDIKPTADNQKQLTLGLLLIASSGQKHQTYYQIVEV